MLKGVDTLDWRRAQQGEEDVLHSQGAVYTVLKPHTLYHYIAQLVICISWFSSKHYKLCNPVRFYQSLSTTDLKLLGLQVIEILVCLAESLMLAPSILEVMIPW